MNQSQFNDLANQIQNETVGGIHTLASAVCVSFEAVFLVMAIFGIASLFRHRKEIDHTTKALMKPTIYFILSQILKWLDTTLFTKSTGNSEFLSIVNEITDVISSVLNVVGATGSLIIAAFLGFKGVTSTIDFAKNGNEDENKVKTILNISTYAIGSLLFSWFAVNTFI